MHIYNEGESKMIQIICRESKFNGLKKEEHNQNRYKMKNTD